MEKSPPGKKKDAVIFVRLTPKEKAAIFKLAKSRDVTVAEFMRSLAQRAVAKAA